MGCLANAAGHAVLVQGRSQMSASILTFPPFRLDPANGCLWRASKRIVISPTDFGVLYHLAAHAGELVTHAELLEAVWPATVVGKGVLKVRLIAFQALATARTSRASSRRHSGAATGSSRQ
jgi:DNA-binding response OmpR family regulator